jgi:kumamolisin
MTDSSGSESKAWALLPGSDRPPAQEALAAPRGLDAEERIEVTLVLRRPAEPNAELGVVTGAEFAERFAAPAEDVEAVRAALEPLGLSVLSVHRPSRRVRVGGTVAAMERAFGTSLRAVSSTGPDGNRLEHRERTGTLRVPAQLDGIVTAVLGLDDRPQARAQTRIASATAGVSYTPLQLGTVYDFPTATDGSGQTIAIIELGAGSGSRTSTPISGGSVSRHRP